jgi:hypothetical protein
LTSLGQKLAILGPPRLVAEVPAERTAAASAFGACGWRLEDRLVDWHRPAGTGSSFPTASDVSEALAPVTFADLDSAGLLGEGGRCWQRDRPALAKEQESLAGLAFQSLDRIEAWALWSDAGDKGETGEPDVPEEMGAVRALPLRALGAVPGALGRLGLVAIAGELGRLSGGAPLHLARVSTSEIEPALLEELGFVRGAEHLLFGTQAKAA